MFTQMLQKQLEAETGFIYYHLPNFVGHFFSKDEAKMVEDESITYHIAFTHIDIYVQKYWVDSKGESQVQEVNVEYDDYNKWYKELNV